MEIITPQLGLFVWTAIIFLGFFFLLRQLAWKPIINALKERENHIEDSLQQADKAREEMSKLKSENEALLKEARAERDRIISDANNLRDQLIKEAREEAAEAGAKEREKAHKQIEAQKRAALDEIQDVAASIAVEVAEKILRKEFADDQKQEEYAKTLIGELNKG